MTLQPLDDAGLGKAPFAIEDTQADTNRLIKLLKDSGGIVAQSDLKVRFSCITCSFVTPFNNLELRLHPSIARCPTRHQVLQSLWRHCGSEQPRAGPLLCCLLSFRYVGLHTCSTYAIDHTRTHVGLAHQERATLVASGSTCPRDHTQIDIQVVEPRQRTIVLTSLHAFAQVRLGYKRPAGHRAFRRLKTALEDRGYVQEVVGTIDDPSSKPVVCVRSASFLTDAAPPVHAAFQSAVMTQLRRTHKALSSQPCGPVVSYAVCDEGRVLWQAAQGAGRASGCGGCRG